jgi:hypothetical protein
MEGMKGKKGGDKGAFPDGMGHAMENQKEQQGICHMKEQVGQVMPGGVQPIELTVQHV